MTVFFRLLDATAEDKPRLLLAAVTSLRANPATEDLHDQSTGRDGSGGVVFERAPGSFRAVPGTPFPYWASDSVMSLFERLSPFASGENTVKQGLASGDDFRLMRLWWEPHPASVGVSATWRSVSKGGSSRPYYADLPLVIGYTRGHQVAIQQIGRFGRGATHYYLPGLTYTLRASRFRPQALPADVITTVRGSGIYAFPSASPFLALFNSSTADYLLKLMLGRGDHPQFDMGDIAALPVPDLTDHDAAVLSTLAREGWTAQRSLDTVNETSHAFLLPSEINEKRTFLDRAAVEQELSSVQEQIDDIAFELFGISSEDRRVIETSVKKGSSAVPAGEDADDDSEDGEEDPLVGVAADALNSWLVGVVFGRFDFRIASGERQIPAEPEPFAPLPSRSPGMYPEGEMPIGHPDVLVDDEGRAEDLTARVQAIAEYVQVNVSENLRGWLAKEFFPLHIKMYSKSRRRAPIYWQLATPSASYSVWLYIHAFSKDTLFRVQNDFVGGERGKLAHEERRLEALRSELRGGATAAQRKQIANQETFVAELRAFFDDVKRIAPLWNPDLDDGVIINFAPLWRLVPQNKSWQKELRSTWDALCKGKYDWAHLAMHLWPERVVPRCTTDRSLAIAHGLEDVFWVEGTDGKWAARKTPTKSVDELVKERTSPAVKSALNSLLDAPVASGKTAARGRVGNGRKSADGLGEDA